MEQLVHLIRHGEVWNPAGIRYGRLNGYRLSLRGESQARTAGRLLRARGGAIARIVSSPLERAQQTAALVQEQLGGVSIETDQRLIEATSRFDGLARTAPLWPWNWRVFPDPFRPSWGEPFVDIVRRVHAAITDLRAPHPGGAIVLVSHQAPIWVARRAFESSLPPWLARVRCSHGSITSLRFVDDRYVDHTYWAPG
ncbi:MAG: histidine phosphatase family protein [Myxococcales bacterium]|nr:histidine phosphatase family protein [Myxococcales bacterium]